MYKIQTELAHETAKKPSPLLHSSLPIKYPPHLRRNSPSNIIKWFGNPQVIYILQTCVRCVKCWSVRGCTQKASKTTNPSQPFWETFSFESIWVWHPSWSNMLTCSVAIYKALDQRQLFEVSQHQTKKGKSHSNSHFLQRKWNTLEITFTYLNV